MPVTSSKSKSSKCCKKAKVVLSHSRSDITESSSATTTSSKRKKPAPSSAKLKISKSNNSNFQTLPPLKQTPLGLTPCKRTSTAAKLITIPSKPLKRQLMIEDCATSLASASTVERRAKIPEYSSASSDLIEEDSVISDSQNWDLTDVSIANHSVVTAPAATR